MGGPRSLNVRGSGETQYIEVTKGVHAHLLSYFGVIWVVSRSLKITNLNHIITSVYVTRAKNIQTEKTMFGHVGW